MTNKSTGMFDENCDFPLQTGRAHHALRALRSFKGL
jgi:hypothetical protein